MKAIYITIATIAIFASSCNKCYQCSSRYNSETICKEDFRYRAIKSGQNISDPTGDNYVCTAK